jgi:glycosyltransferase involved in cell wall biosynthesis
VDAWAFGLAARRLGIPIVRGRHISKPLPRSFLRRLPFTRLADAFTVSAPVIGRELEQAGVPRERIFLTPAGIDLERFSPERREPHALRAELGLSAGTRLVGTACNLRTMKGIDVLVRAFDAWIARSGADAVLVLAGSGDPEPFRALAVHAPERLRFLGFRQDVERVIGGLDLFVLASRAREAMSQVVPQAMALGVPVVTSDAGGLPDLVRDGETGTLVRAEDPEALSFGIESALRRPPEVTRAVCERARAFVAEHFPLATIVSRYLDAYALVLGRAREARISVSGAGRA